jgi:hypothetical protein
MSKLDKVLIKLGEVYDQLDQLIFESEQATLENIEELKEIISYLNRAVKDIENNPVL